MFVRRTIKAPAQNYGGFGIYTGQPVEHLTTGTAARDDRVTEVGIVRIDDEARVSEWSTLVNPECSIPPAIQALTGITNAMVAEAPTFQQIADDVAAQVGGAVFVAHNARFDYGFLKHEFARLGRSFTAKVL